MREANPKFEPRFERYRIIPKHLYKLVDSEKIETKHDTLWAVLEDKTTIVLVSEEFLWSQEVHEPGWINSGEWEFRHAKKLGRVPVGFTQFNDLAVLLNIDNCGFSIDVFKRKTTVPFVQDGFLKISIG